MGCGGSTTAEPPVELKDGQVHAKDVSVGQYVLIDERPCKVTEVKPVPTKDPKKVKAFIKGEDVFTFLEKAKLCPDGDAIDLTEITTTEYTLVDDANEDADGADIDDDAADNLKLKDAAGAVREDMTMKNCEENIGNAITNLTLQDKPVKLTVVKHGSVERIVSAKEA